MERWEYMVTVCNDDAVKLELFDRTSSGDRRPVEVSSPEEGALIVHLNELGRDSWQVISTEHQVFSGGNERRTFFLGRRVQ